MRKISIISLGRLGSETYKALQENPTYSVAGTYHSSPKGYKNETQYNYQVDLITQHTKSADIILFNLTPTGIHSEQVFEGFLKQIKEQHFIFISSTSVYGNQGLVDEKTDPIPLTENGKLLLKCESLIQEKMKKFTIIRPGGIYSDSSHPARFLSGRTQIKGGNNCVNLIHLKEIVSTIILSFTQNENKIINCVNSHHPLKKDYYTDFCKKNGLALPLFDNENGMGNKEVGTLHKEFKIESLLP